MKDKFYHGKIFYGWYIVIAAVLLMAVCWGVVFNTASLFIDPISTELGISRQAMNLTFSIRSICQLAVALFSGVIYKKLKMINLMKIASVTSVLSLFLHSYIKSLGSLYLLTAISGSSIILLGTLPLSTIINNWFHEKNGTAIGLAFMGSGLGGMLFNSLSGVWIITYGWRITYQILAIIMLVTVIPTVFVIIKINPKDVGLSPFGESKANDIDTLDKKDFEYDGIMLSEARKTSLFWIICLGSVTLTMSGITLLNNIAPHLTNINYSPTFSANIVALSMGSLALGKLILGYLFDRLGLKITTLLSSVAIILGLISLLYADKNIALLIMLVCVGLGCSYLTVGYPVVVQVLFGRKDYSAIYGILNAAHSIGGIISPVIIGYLFDRTDSYNSSFMIMAVIAVISSAIFQLAFMKNKVARNS